jgi:proline dehydrogenase
MLRNLILYLSRAGWARRIVTHWGVARRVARRFVAGETEAQAVEAVRRLNAEGLTATLDVLGESITTEEQAHEMARAYVSLLDAVHANELEATVSLKLTSLGLDLSQALCEDTLGDLLAHAAECGTSITIDMEDSSYTERTLTIFRKLRAQGFDNVRTVIQAALYRSEEDIERLAGEGAGIRLCKGAYREPPAVAHPKKSEVDAAYVREMKVLLDAAFQGHGYPGIATHDEAIINEARRYTAAQSIPADVFEFQMLHGIRDGLQRELAGEGYGMRVYVPFGTQWYPYFMRRLAERPANVWFFVSNFFKR